MMSKPCVIDGGEGESGEVRSIAQRNSTRARCSALALSNSMSSQRHGFVRTDVALELATMREAQRWRAGIDRFPCRQSSLHGEAARHHGAIAVLQIALGGGHLLSASPA